MSELNRLKAKSVVNTTQVNLPVQANLGLLLTCNLRLIVTYKTTTGSEESTWDFTVQNLNESIRRISYIKYTSVGTYDFKLWLVTDTDTVSEHRLLMQFD